MTGRLDLDDEDAEAFVQSAILQDHVDRAEVLPVVHGTLALIVIGLFWTSVAHWRLAMLAASIGFACCTIIVTNRRFRAATSVPEVRRSLVQSCFVTLTLTGSWGCSLCALFITSGAEGRLFVTAIMAGLLPSTLIQGPILRNALAFSAPLLLASTIAIFATGEMLYMELAPLVAVVGLAVAVAVARGHRLAVEHFLTQYRNAEQRATIEILLHDFEEDASDFLWETDAALCLRHVPERMILAKGASREALAGTSLLSVMTGCPAQIAQTQTAQMKTAQTGAAPAENAQQEAGLLAAWPGYAALHQALHARLPFKHLVVRVDCAGAHRWWSLSGKPMTGRDGAFAGYRGAAGDITEAHDAQLQLAAMARQDFLTGLDNRLTLREAVAAACGDAITGRQDSALIYIDLDGFKEVNDTLGHLAGDGLLRDVAQRLRQAASPGDVVARIGGDEFVVLHRLHDGDDSERFGNLLLERLSLPCAVRGDMLQVGASLGIALTPRDSTDPQDLLHFADLALYQAKTSGRGRVCLYHPDFGKQAAHTQGLQSDLRRALTLGEFAVHYQPLMRCTDGTIGGCEALLRWQHPARGSVPPSEFIPLAEAQGLIVPIGQWVLETACAEAACWSDDKIVAVNLSPAQFRAPDLVQHVRQALSRSGLDPHRLELEITESAMLDGSASTLATLNELRGLGVRLALDDFGAGYSALGYLLRFRFDKIKLDRAFTRELVHDGNAAAIVDTVIDLAARIGMEVTIEGVETTDQAHRLLARRCHYLQGFLFSAARPPEHVREMMLGGLPFAGQLEGALVSAPRGVRRLTVVG